MLLNTEALSSYVSVSSYDRSLEAARRHELDSAIRRQRQDRRNRKRTQGRQWFAARRAAWSRP